MLIKWLHTNFCAYVLNYSKITMYLFVKTRVECAFHSYENKKQYDYEVYQKKSSKLECMKTVSQTKRHKHACMCHYSATIFEGIVIFVEMGRWEDFNFVTDSIENKNNKTRMIVQQQQQQQQQVLVVFVVRTLVDQHATTSPLHSV